MQSRSIIWTVHICSNTPTLLNALLKFTLCDCPKCHWAWEWKSYWINKLYCIMYSQSVNLLIQGIQATNYGRITCTKCLKVAITDSNPIQFLSDSANIPSRSVVFVHFPGSVNRETKQVAWTPVAWSRTTLWQPVAVRGKGEVRDGLTL